MYFSEVYNWFSLSHPIYRLKAKNDIIVCVVYFYRSYVTHKIEREGYKNKVQVFDIC